MTTQYTAAGTLTRDELQAVVSMLCSRFPERSRVEVEWLVGDVYRSLFDGARVRNHLIPLTLNRCRSLLSEGRLPETTDHATT